MNTIFSLCPERNFKRDEIPYQTVREIVEKHLSSMDSEKRQLLEARMRGETEQGPSGNFPVIFSIINYFGRYISEKQSYLCDQK